jgi:apolipoprotein N-acyltransferase
VNLAVWSETMMPPLNREAIQEEYDTLHSAVGQEMHDAVEAISALAAAEHVGVLAGGHFWDKFTMTKFDDATVEFPAEQRNTSYLFEPDGTFGDRIGQRYDKLHLVPFGEYIPLRHTFLYQLFLALGPKYYSAYELVPGLDNGLTVFSLQDAAGVARWRFVTPICFEDGDARVCSAMMRPGADGKKRADFFVNITNDGWFPANQNVQHFQLAIFRAIENRAPMARSVNTGISGFIDSVGHVANTLAVRTAGTSVMQLQLDSRLTLYTEYGDFFAWMCVAAAGVCTLVAMRGMRSLGGLGRFLAGRRENPHAREKNPHPREKNPHPNPPPEYRERGI